MANLLALNNVYNHYLTTYARGTVSRYDTHKKSELRNIYNSIVKLNKESPLYILDNSREAQSFAVGVKEGARELHNLISSLSGQDEDELLNKKVAYSSNENIAEAQFIGSYQDGDKLPSFEIEVKSLASPQVNLGKFLEQGKTDCPPDTYAFDINTNNLSYEFQYRIHENDTNRDIQERLARLICGADIGVLADVAEDGSGRTALRLTSASTGESEGQKPAFTVSDSHSSKAAGSVEYLGIDDITRSASDAVFMINGKAHTASSNHFTVEKAYELTLNGISSVEGETARIGLKNDTESLTENIGKLVNGYNDFVHTAFQYSDRRPRSMRLVNEMKGLTAYHSGGLDNIGLTLQEDGTISINDNMIQQTLSDGDLKETLDSMKSFANSILRKTNQVSINPMNYVDKTIVTYKNPGKNFATPYITSAYSGMMFNSYC